MTTALMTLPSWSLVNGLTEAMPSGTVYNCRPGGQIAANLADLPALTAIGFVPVTNGIFSRIRHLAKTAWNNNPHALPVIASPPTITTLGAFPPSGFASTPGASFYQIPASSPNGPIPSGPNMMGPLRLFGGYPSVSLNAAIQMPNMTQGASSSGNAGSNAAGQGIDASTFRIEFMADAAKIAFGVIGQDGVPWRFLVNGQYVSLTGTHVATGGRQTIELDFTSAGGRAVRKIAIEGCQGDAFLGVAVQPTESIFPADTDDLLRMIVLGDSYTFGTGIAGQYSGDAWARVMGDYLGIRDMWCSGLGGTGYLRTTSTNTYTLRQRLTDATSHNPDIVAFAMGNNDAGVFTPAQIQTEVQLAIQAFRAACPATPLVVFGTFGENSGPSTAMIQNEQATQAAVAAVGDTNTIFVPLCTASSPVLTGTGTIGAPTGAGNCDVYINAGDVHPTAAGHAYIGQWAASAFLSASVGMI
jgi:lysophospholipase L1-like esterase